MSCLAILSGCSQPSADDERRGRIDEMYLSYRKDFAGAPEITVAEALEAVAAGPVVVVDVREAEERDVSMIPNAIYREQFEQNAEKYRAGKIIVYCTIGYRSGQFVKELAAKGFRAFNLRGGILAATHAGQELVSKRGPTRRVHVYCEKWNLVADGYQAVWYPGCAPPGS